MSLYSEDLRLIVSEEHQLAKRSSVTMADLKMKILYYSMRTFILMIKL